MKHYILDENKKVIAADLMEWARWFEKADRTVARSTVEGSEISTVFLGLDHSFEKDGPPVLWETMVLGGPLSDEMDRCSGTWQDAETMHEKMVAEVRRGEGRKDS